MKISILNATKFNGYPFGLRFIGWLISVTIDQFVFVLQDKDFIVFKLLFFLINDRFYRLLHLVSCFFLKNCSTISLFYAGI